MGFRDGFVATSCTLMFQLCVNDLVAGSGATSGSGGAAAAREDAAIRSLADSGGFLSVGDILAANEAGVADDTVRIKESDKHRKAALEGLLNAPIDHIPFYDGLCLGRTISAPMQSMSEFNFIC